MLQGKTLLLSSYIQIFLIQNSFIISFFIFSNILIGILKKQIII